MCRRAGSMASAMTPVAATRNHVGPLPPTSWPRPATSTCRRRGCSPSGDPLDGPMDGPLPAAGRMADELHRDAGHEQRHGGDVQHRLGGDVAARQAQLLGAGGVGHDGEPGDDGPGGQPRRQRVTTRAVLPPPVRRRRQPSRRSPRCRAPCRDPPDLVGTVEGLDDEDHGQGDDRDQLQRGRRDGAPEPRQQLPRHERGQHARHDGGRPVGELGEAGPWRPAILGDEEAFVLHGDCCQERRCGDHEEPAAEAPPRRPEEGSTDRPVRRGHHEPAHQPPVRARQLGPGDVGAQRQATNVRPAAISPQTAAIATRRHVARWSIPLPSGVQRTTRQVLTERY